jgi:hypothetical protein
VLSRHRLITVAVGLAALIRLAAVLGYRPVLWFSGDSFAYVQNTDPLQTNPTRPSGYSVILWLLRPFHSLALVSVLQHVAGLVTAVLIYLLLRRRGCSATFATAGACPVLFDGYQIAIEHFVLSEVWFTLALVAAVVVALWSPVSDLTVRQGCVIGALLGAACVLRTVGVPIAVVVVAWLVLQRVRWRVAGVVAGLVVAAMVGYMSWFDAEHGNFRTSYATGPFLWARTAVFADCARIRPPVTEQWLCPSRHRPRVDDSLYKENSPLQNRPGYPKWSPQTDHITGDFAKRAIRAQPMDYLRASLASVSEAFGGPHGSFPTGGSRKPYRFPKPHAKVKTFAQQQITRYGNAYEHGSAFTRAVPPFSGMLRAYQRWIYLRRPFLALLCLICAWGTWRDRRRRGGPALLLLGTALALVVVPAFTAETDPRYLIPAFPLVAVGTVLALRSHPA